MGLADLVVLAGVVQDTLGGGGLAGIDVSHDADVANLIEVSKHLVCHYISPSFEVRVLKHPARSGWGHREAGGVITSGSERTRGSTQPSCACLHDA